MTKNLIMGTAGHVDHGKTALISALTGIDCDTHKEEKERGITINLGFAHLELNNELSLGIVDVPGHKDFIRTMVAGAYGIDFVLLVVAADSGIMPQTREHFDIMRMLGVTKGLVALNKADLVDDEMLELAKLEIMEFLEDTPMEDAPIIAVSSITGQGIEDLKKEIEKTAFDIPEKSHTQKFRLYIDRIFNVKGQGIVITGSVLGGEVKSGQELVLLPGYHDKIRIKSIQRHGKTVDHTSAGDRAAMNLSGLKYDDFERGMLLSDSRLDDIDMLDAQVEIFDLQIRLKTWNHLIFHTGTFSTKARMHLLTADSLSGNEKAVVQFHLEKPAILLKNDKFIIRNSSNDLTLGGGRILDVNPLHHRRRTDTLKQNMQFLADAMMNKANLFHLIMLEMEKSGRAMKLDEIAGKISSPTEEIENTVKENPGSLHVFETSDLKYLLTNSFMLKIKSRIIDELKTFHTQNKLFERGLDSKELRGKLPLTTTAETGILDQLLQQLLTAGEIKTVDKTFALKNHTVKPDKKMQEQLNWIDYAVGDIGLQRLTFSELDKKAVNEGIKRGQLKMLLQFMAGRGELYFNGEDILPASAVDKARLALLHDLADKPRGINEKDFRMLIDAPKKTIQVLIDIFTKEGIITKETFFIHITEMGRGVVASK